MNNKGPIAWMIKNPVAANLLMGFFIFGGLLATSKMRQEVFPKFDSDRIAISIPYPGADPIEIENGILKPIEEALRSIEGVKKIQSTAQEGSASISVQAESYADPKEVLSDVKNQMDRISNLPVDAEEPQIALVSSRSLSVSLILSGDFEPQLLRKVAERIKEKLLNTNRISQVEVSGVPVSQVKIEISKDAVLSYGISLDKISDLIKAQSVDLPAGAIKTTRGKISVQFQNKQTEISQLNEMILFSPLKNQYVKLGDLANIQYELSDVDQESYLDGERSAEVKLYTNGNEKPTEVSELIYEIKDEMKGEYPPSLRWQIWGDRSEILRDRINLLLKNAVSGGFLVLIVLGLFLNRKLAFWVAMGIPTSFLGAFFILQSIDISINMVSLFALIVTLGIVVDDAIVIAESVYSRVQNGESPIEAATKGSASMAVPVSFSILTTIAAFAPLLFIEGGVGKTFSIIPAVVIVVLTLSWLESFFVLPAHLAHMNFTEKPHSIWKKVDDFRAMIQVKLDFFIKNRYKNTLIKALNNPLKTISLFTIFAMIVFSTIPLGLVGYRFFPKLESSSIKLKIEYPFGTPLELTRSTAKAVEAAARKTEEKLGPNTIRGINTDLGSESSRDGSNSGSHIFSMRLDIGQSSDREYSSNEFISEWKKAMPPLPGIKVMQMDGSVGPATGKDADIELSNINSEILKNAADWLASKLRQNPIYTEVENGSDVGTPRLDLKIKPQAMSMGINTITLAKTIRTSLQGTDVYKVQMSQNEVRFKVQLPESERRDLNSIMSLMIPINGQLIPLEQLVEISWNKSPGSIEREDGRQLVRVKADFESENTQHEIIALKEGLLKQLEERFPGTQWQLGGQQRDQAESFASLGPNYILALVLIFILIAIPFKSYLLPLVVMSVIPFGLVGALMGHLSMGYSLSFVSMLGCVALSGVVVNDSIVFVDAFNSYRAEGKSIYDSLIESGIQRFRPILLTSLTTFFGLVPMIFETSVQAKFLIPMAISLGFGALFVTVIVLILIPSIMILLSRFLQSKEPLH